MSPEASPDYDVFVSHAHADGEAVQPLLDALRSLGMRVWFDEDAIETHASITASVRDGVSRSKVLVAYYSAVYSTRRACQWELTAAFLAAQRLGEDPCRRVLVINPERLADGEPRFDHIRPIELADAKAATVPTADAGFWSDEAERIARLASEHTRALSNGGGLLPRQVPRRLIDTPGFVGRLDALWDAHSALMGSDAVMITGASGGDVAQLAGMGGVGKSLLAQEYGLRFGAAYPGGVFWLRDSDPDGTLSSTEREAMLNAQLREVAEFLGVAGDSTSELRGAIARELESSGRCLWVVDGLAVGLVDDEVRQWLAPHPNARTLLTTRSRNYQLARRVDLGSMTPTEGYELLTARRTPDEEDREAARRIVEDLGGHALALSVAGRALKAMSGMRSFAQYREMLAEPSADELEFAAQLEPELPDERERSIATTLLRSISLLDDPGYDTLRIASLLAPVPLSKAILADIFRHADSLSPTDAMRRAAVGCEQVCGLSLAEPAGNEGDEISVHTLVARTLRFKEPRSDRRHALWNAAILALTRALSDSGGAPRGSTEIIPHALGVIGQFALWGPEGVKTDPRIMLLTYSVGSDALSHGNYESAKQMFELTLSLLDQTPRKDAPPPRFNGLVKEQLALTLEALGDATSASRLLDEVIANPEQRAPYEDFESVDVDARTHLIRTLLRSGEVERAIELQHEDIEEVQAAHGTLSAEALRLASYQAFQLAIFTDEPYRERAVDEQRAFLVAHANTCGELHPETLQLKHDYALTLTTLGEDAAARALFEEVLDARLSPKGRAEYEPRKILITMYQIALLLGDDEADEAIPLLRYVVDASARWDGDGSQLNRRAKELLERFTGEEPASDRPRPQPEPTQRRSTAPPRHVAGRSIGRNDPCWCGSGQKFKRCHGR